MDQISPPMRIALVVVVVFAAAYMLVLRPKDEAVTPAAVPPPVTAPASDAGGADATTGLGKAVEGAREAAGATEAAQDASSGETETKPEGPSTTSSAPEAPVTKPAPEPGAKPTDEALADLPKWLRDSMDQKVVALLFTNRESADDLRTERALRHAYKGDDEVVARSVNVREIARYQSVAEGLDVSQSPTLMVIARDRTAHANTGYASLDTINQMIIDGLLATENPAAKVPFLELAQSEGRRVNNRDLIGVTEGTTPAGAEKNARATVEALNGALGKLRNSPVPKRYEDVKRTLIRLVEAKLAFGREFSNNFGPNGVDLVALKAPAKALLKVQRETLLVLNAVGVDSWN